MQRVVQRYDMLKEQDGVVVAVSGGPDSLALLHLLWRLSHTLRLCLTVAHLNHNLRPEAVQEAQVVARLSDSLGLRCVVGSRDVKSHANEQGLSVQEAARQVRYAFLDHVATSVRARRIAVGHHADDQAETVLMRFLSGAGPRGLAGIPPVRERVIRPLLWLWKRDLEAYCQDHNLVPVRDASNESPHYLRNRIRQDLIPALESTYQPELRPLLVQMAEIARADEAYLTTQAQEAFADVVAYSNNPGPGAGGPWLLLSLAKLSALPLALKRRVIRLALGAVGLPERRITFGHVDAILAVADGSVPQTALPQDCIARREGAGAVACLYLGPVSSPMRKGATQATVWPLVVPGETTVAELAIRIEAMFVDAEETPPRSLGTRRDQPGEWPAAAPWLGADITVDYGALVPPFWVRTRRPGDRMAPVGLGGRKKVQDILVDAKVPRRLRDDVPLIGDARGIFWIPGLALDARVKPGHHVMRRLLLRSRKLS